MANKAKHDRVRERVYLTFPKDLIKEPVLSQLAKQFDVVFNIRGSTVTSRDGIGSVADRWQRRRSCQGDWLA